MASDLALTTTSLAFWAFQLASLLQWVLNTLSSSPFSKASALPLCSHIETKGSVFVFAMPVTQDYSLRGGRFLGQHRNLKIETGLKSLSILSF